MAYRSRRYLSVDVLTAAKKRISFIFDNFERLYVSFSGGKDSSVLFHLVAEEAEKRKRKFGVLFIDWEAQYKLTIQHVESMLKGYSKQIEPYWITLPLKTVSSVSQFEPEWICWDKTKRDLWIRSFPKESISDEFFFPFYKQAMTFEEFVPEFGEWYAQGKMTACFVGIRTSESLNRFRTLVRAKEMFKAKPWTTLIKPTVFNIYPIYDWKTEDIWRYNGKFGKPYNKLYDLMYKAGIPIHNQRVDEFFGTEARRGLQFLHVIEPDTWGRIVGRFVGANSGALYVKEMGSILGNGKIKKPQGFTWKSFAQMLLVSMPEKTAEHYRNKFTVYLKWYKSRGYPNDIPDELTGDLGSTDIPSWRRICKTLLRNDYWCKALDFNPTKASHYEAYKKTMEKRRQRWGIQV